jgi:hypothetical protein
MLPSQGSLDWTGDPPFHRSFVLRGLLRSPGSSRSGGMIRNSTHLHYLEIFFDVAAALPRRPQIRTESHASGNCLVERPAPSHESRLKHDPSKVERDAVNVPMSFPLHERINGRIGTHR